MRLLTTSGYEEVTAENFASYVGREVPAFDVATGAPIVNTIEGVEWIEPGAYDQPRWQIAEGQAVMAEPRMELVYDPVPFRQFVVNGTWRLFMEQSVWANGNVTHARLLQAGDELYDDADQPFLVDSIVEEACDGWLRFTVSGDHSYIADGLTLHNASRFWVGGTGNTSDSANHWASVTNGSPGASVPGSGDTATWDSNSGGSAFTATVPNGTPLSVTSATINNTNATVTCADTFTASGALTLTIGAFNDGGKAISVGSLSSNNTNTRSLTRSGTWSVTGTGTIWNIADPTGLTHTASSTAAIKFTANTAVTRTFNTGGLTYNDFYITAGSGTVNFANATPQFRNWDFTGYTGTLGGNIAVNVSGNITNGTGMSYASVGSTLTLNGTSGTQTITCNGVALQRTLTINAPGATVSLADDLAVGVSALLNVTWTNGNLSLNGHSFTATSAFSSTNANARTLAFGTGGRIAVIPTSGGLNSTSGNPINFAGSGASLTVTGTGTLEIATTDGATAHSLTLGGAGADFGAIDLLVSAGTGTVNIAGTGSTVHSLTFGAGFSGTLGASLNTFDFKGNITLSASMTASDVGATWNLSGASLQTVTSNGVVLNRNVSVAAGSSVRIADSLDLGTRAFSASPTATVTVTAGKGISAGSYAISGTAGNLVTLQSGTAHSPFNITLVGGHWVSADYLSVTDSAASPATNSWFAGAHSTDGGGNTGWIFTTPIIPVALSITASTTVARLRTISFTRAVVVATTVARLRTIGRALAVTVGSAVARLRTISFTRAVSTTAVVAATRLRTLVRALAITVGTTVTRLRTISFTRAVTTIAVVASGALAFFFTRWFFNLRPRPTTWSPAARSTDWQPAERDTLWTLPD